MSKPLLFCPDCRPDEPNYYGFEPEERGPLPVTCCPAHKKRRQRRIREGGLAALGPYVYDDYTGEYLYGDGLPPLHRAAALIDDYGREAESDDGLEVGDAAGPPMRALSGAPEIRRTLAESERDEQYRAALGVAPADELPRSIGTGGATDPERSAPTYAEHLPADGYGFDDRFSNRKFYDAQAKETRSAVAALGKARGLSKDATAALAKDARPEMQA